jgi:hypothetical protein
MDYFFKAPTIKYCEVATNALIARPWYALSNIAFLIVGLLILKKGGRYRILGAVALLIGILSFTYDASYTYLSQLLDLSGMLIFISILLYFNLRLLSSNRRKLISLLVAGFVASICIIIIFRGYTGDVVFGLLVLSYIISELYILRTKRHINRRRWVIALGIFALGFIFWLCDASRIYCLDFGLLNGRAIFHYTNAVSIYLLFTFYRSQVKSSLAKQ